MRVLYDLGLVASSFWRAGSRTGVFRVNEELALALARRADFDLRFTASSSLGGLVDYLQAHQNLPADLLHSALAVALSRRIEPLRPMVMDTLKNRSFIHRAGRRLISLALKYLEPRIARISASQLRGIDLFHSPGFNLPPQMAADRRIQKAVNIYDMIAIHSPDLFDAGIVRRMKGRVRECCRDDTWVLAISQATKDEFCEYTKVSPSRVFVTPLAAGDCFFPERDPAVIAAARGKHGIPEGPYLLSVCTLEPRKNLHTVIKAFAELIRAEKIPDLNLVLVGNVGWKYEAIFAEFESYPELKDRIVFPGYVPDEALRAIYSDAIAFVYMSVYEGFGLPPLEAMQCGVPVITSNVSSLPEVVGDAGIMLPPRDVPAISDAMLRLYANGDLRRTLAEAGLARAKSFSWDRCAADTVHAYREMLE